MDAMRNETIAKIAKWVKEHPKATKEEVTKELSKQITLFAKKVDQMWKKTYRTLGLSPKKYLLYLSDNFHDFIYANIFLHTDLYTM